SATIMRGVALARCGPIDIALSGSMACDPKNFAIAWVYSWLRFLDHVPHVERRGTIPINLFHHPTFNCPDLLRRSPGAEVVLTDKEDNVLNKLECMIEHQLLHFTVVAPTPISSHQERPSNFDL